MDCIEVQGLKGDHTDFPVLYMRFQQQQGVYSRRTFIHVSQLSWLVITHHF